MVEKSSWREAAERRGVTLSDLIRRVMNAIAAGKIKRIPGVQREDEYAGQNRDD